MVKRLSAQDDNSTVTTNAVFVAPVLGTPASATLTNATGLPISGLVSSTSAPLGVGVIELGHATDTSLSRGAAGRLSVEGVFVPTISSTDTLTNKTIATSGNTISNPYKFKARRVAAQNSGNGAFAIINFDTEDYDTNNNFTISGNVGRYTAPVSGFYHFDSRAAATSSVQFLIALYKNGTLLERGGHSLGSGTYGVTLSTDIQATAGDYFEIYSFGTGGALEVSSPILFSGHFISHS